MEQGVGFLFLLVVIFFFVESLAYSKDKRCNRNNCCHDRTKKVVRWRELTEFLSETRNKCREFALQTR